MNELLSQPVRNIIECIESWHDTEGNWYRIYSDGWCEQGGVCLAPKTANTNQIELFKEYSDTNYSVFIQFETDATSHYSYVGYPTSYQKQTNKFLYTGNNAQLNPRIRWEAKGYVK